MKTSSQRKKQLKMQKCFFAFCVFQLLILPTQVRSQESKGLGDRRSLFGIHLGFSENKVDIYHVENGEALALKQGNHSFYVPNFRLAVIYDLRLNHCFSLRVMPGIRLLDYQWEPGTLTGIALQHSNYKLESLCGELPVDIKLHPFRKGNFEPFLLGGIVYGFDFTSLRNDSEGVCQMNANDFRCNFGIGVDCYTPILKLGVELKAGFGVIQPNTTSNDNPFYFKNGPIFSFGVSIEA